MKLASKLSARSNAFQKVIDACRHLLDKDELAQTARDYIDERTSPKTQIQYEFGFFPSNEHLHKLTNEVGLELLKSLFLVYPKFISIGTELRGHFNHHNLIMPFRNSYGDIVGLVGRTLISPEKQKKEQIQKYKYSFNSNKQMHLFGLNKAKDAIIENDFAICVEGQFDCITCHEFGIKNVVACGGSTLTPYQLFQLLRYTNNLVLLLDNDNAGMLARKTIKKRYGQYANIGAMTPPNGCKDIDQFLRTSLPSDREKAVFALKNLYQQIRKVA